MNHNVILFFQCVAIISTVLFVLKLIIFSIFGGDAEVEGDFDVADEVDTSFDFLSIQSVLAFLMGFGWIGWACLSQFGMRIRFAFLIALVFGFMMMYFSAWLMFCIKKLNHRVKKDFSKCAGLSGRAYTGFKPNGKGQIEIDFNNQLSIEEAINNSDCEIKSFENIKVVKYENGILYIEKE